MLCAVRAADDLLRRTGLKRQRISVMKSHRIDSMKTYDLHHVTVYHFVSFFGAEGECVVRSSSNGQTDCRLVEKDGQRIRAFLATELTSSDDECSILSDGL